MSAAAVKAAGGGSSRAGPSRRWGKVLLIVVAGLILLRVALALLLPVLLRGQLAERGLSADWERLSLSLLAGDLELVGLRVAPATEADRPEPGEGVAGLGLLRVDIATGALLAGRLHVRRAELERFDLHLQRDGDGRWSTRPELDLALLFPQEEEPESAPREAVPERWPLRADVVRAEHLVVHVHDARDGTGSEPRRFELEGGVLLEGFGGEAPARLGVRAHSPDGLESLRVDGELSGTPRALQFGATVALRGLRPDGWPVERHELGLPEQGERLDLQLRLGLRHDVQQEGRGHLVASLTELDLRVDGEVLLACEELSAELTGHDGRWQPHALELRALQLDAGPLLAEDAPVRAAQIGTAQLLARPDEPGAFDVQLAASAPGAVEELRVGGTLQAEDPLDFAAGLRAEFELALRGPGDSGLGAAWEGDLAALRDAALAATARLSLRRTEAGATELEATLGPLAVSAGGGGAAGDADDARDSDAAGDTSAEADTFLLLRSLGAKLVSRTGPGATRTDVEGVSLTGLALHWPPRSADLRVEELSAELGPLVLGGNPGDAPVDGRLELSLALPGRAESVSLTGALRTHPGSEQRELQAGLRASGLALSAPGEWELAVQFDAHSAAAREGGLRGHFALDDLSLRDVAQPDAPAAASLAALRVGLARHDAAATVTVLDEFSLLGAHLPLRRAPGGALHVAGLELGAGDPLALDLRAELVADGPLVLLDPEPAAAPPWSLRLRAAAEPLLSELALDLSLHPLVPEPRAELSLAATGISGSALSEALPVLAQSLDASGLDGGRIDAQLELSARPSRRGAWDFELAAGFPATLDLRDLTVRAADGTLLAGLDGLALDIARVLPGEALEVAAVELVTPRLLAVREPAGWRVGGVLQRAEAAPEPPPAPAPEPAAEPAAADAPGLAVNVEQLLGRGLHLLVVDELVTPPLRAELVDMDLSVAGLGTRNFAGEPLRWSLWLAAGELELRRRVQASSLLAGVAKAAAGALSGAEDTWEVEQRPLFADLLAGGQLVLGPQRSGFVQATVDGLELAAFAGPAAAAGVQIGDGVLDLALRVQLPAGAPGSVDATLGFTDLSLSESAGGPLSTWLSLPAPVDTVLFLLRDNDERHRFRLSFELPPEGGVDGVTRAAARALGSLLARAVASSPLRVAGGVTNLVGLTGEGGLVGRIGLAGLLGGRAEGPSGASFTFRAGGVSEEHAADSLPPEELSELLEQLQGRWTDWIPLLGTENTATLVVEHVFGPEDFERAEQLGNPGLPERSQLAGRLRQQHAEALRRRDELAAATRALHAVGEREAAAEQGARLAELDVEIAGLSAALDRTLAGLRSGADRQRETRTRQMALALARARLLVVRELLREAAGERVSDLDARLVLRNPRVNDVDPDGPRVAVSLVQP